jgi:hypothetical protein
MKFLVAKIIAIAAIGFVLTGCNRNQTPAPPQPAAAPAASVAPPPPAPAAPAPIPASTELPLNSVDSVMLSRPQDSPMAIVIHVSGTAISPGWKDAKLAEDTDTAADANIKTYKFVATSPDMPDQNRSPQPIEAEIRVESLSADVKTIRIVSATNEISAPIAQ